MVRILFVKVYRVELVRYQHQFHTIILTKPAKIKHASSLHYSTAHSYTTAHSTILYSSVIFMAADHSRRAV
jgi:hypothetical protein